MDTYTKHSTYKGVNIWKVTQPSGRVTYDLTVPNPKLPGYWTEEPIDGCFESLAVARAYIRA